MKNYQTSTRRAGTTGRTTAGKAKKDAARAAKEGSSGTNVGNFAGMTRKFSL